MKIIDQYVEAVVTRLPMKGRADIRKELKSLLHDELETEYGEAPKTEQVREFLLRFGSPASVAERYASPRVPISSEYTDLYFLVFKIIPFAMAVAFTVIFVISVITGNLQGKEVAGAFGNALLNIVQGSVSGIGTVTIIFIILSYLRREKGSRSDEVWNPDELDEISVPDLENNGSQESMPITFIGIIFLSTLAILILARPEIVTAAENSFLKSGLSLGHRLDVNVFRGWSYVLAGLWILEIVRQLAQIRRGGSTGFYRISGYVQSCLSIAVTALMLADRRLYIEDRGYIGFKIIFIIVLAVTAIEFIGETGKLIAGRIRKKLET